MRKIYAILQYFITPLFRQFFPKKWEILQKIKTKQVPLYFNVETGEYNSRSNQPIVLYVGFIPSLKSLYLLKSESLESLCSIFKEDVEEALDRPNQPLNFYSLESQVKEALAPYGHVLYASYHKLE